MLDPVHALQTMEVAKPCSFPTSPLHVGVLQSEVPQITDCSTGPYVTSVGGTTGTSPEKTVDFSSGGFSNYFGIPDYQASAVSTFLGQLGDTYSGLYKYVYSLIRYQVPTDGLSVLRVEVSLMSPHKALDSRS